MHDGLIHICCPKCGFTRPRPASYAGKTEVCPQCNTAFTAQACPAAPNPIPVPAAPMAPLNSTSPQLPAVPPVPTMPASPESTAERIALLRPPLADREKVRASAQIPKAAPPPADADSDAELQALRRANGNPPMERVRHWKLIAEAFPKKSGQGFIHGTFIGGTLGVLGSLALAWKLAFFLGNPVWGMVLLTLCGIFFAVAGALFIGYIFDHLDGSISQKELRQMDEATRLAFADRQAVMTLPESLLPDVLRVKNRLKNRLLKSLSIVIWIPLLMGICLYFAYKQQNYPLARYCGGCYHALIVCLKQEPSPERDRHITQAKADFLTAKKARFPLPRPPFPAL